MGVVGMVAPELLGKLGLVPAETAIPWFQTGVILQISPSLQYSYIHPRGPHEYVHLYGTRTYIYCTAYTHAHSPAETRIVVNLASLAEGDASPWQHGGGGAHLPGTKLVA